MIYVCIGELIIGLLFLLIYFTDDNLITRKRLKDNQIAWDEYSNGMTFSEKNDCYLDWCTNRKLENGWRFYYFPRM